MNEFFRKISHFASEQVGKPWAFVLALLLIIIWGFGGSASNYSNTWQLVINTATTILTFLMVFLIQNTQNREAKAINLKLDELLVAIKRAKDSMVDVEDATDKELDILESQYQKIGRKAQQRKP
jgi:low affinity Fe/Cu permease